MVMFVVWAAATERMLFNASAMKTYPVPTGTAVNAEVQLVLVVALVPSWTTVFPLKSRPAAERPDGQVPAAPNAVPNVDPLAGAVMLTVLVASSVKPATSTVASGVVPPDA